MQLNLLNGMLAQATTTAAAGPAGAPAQPNLLMQFAPMILLVVVFYFILIRPQQKRAKEQAKMLAALKSGDRVLTGSGIIATVTSVKEKTVFLRSGDSKLEVSKASVTEILEAGTTTTES